MKDLIFNFPQQLQEAVEIGNSAHLAAFPAEIKNILVCGMGGSGIGGKIVCQIISDELKIPMTTNSSYMLPAFVDANTLVIVSSYSGNTEETLTALQEAMHRKANIVCITTGGLVLELAKKHGIRHIIVPAGSPPRAALGYSLVQQLVVLSRLGFIQSKTPDILQSAEKLGLNQEKLMQQAQDLAAGLQGKIPVIYCDGVWEGVAIRFRQQLNENSKILCWHNVFPELNHNEIVGWTLASKDIAVVLLRDEADYPRNVQRIEISKKLISAKAAIIVEVWAKGSSTIEKTLYLIHLLDWVSLFLCEKNGQDPMAIVAIDHLKDELARQ